MGANVGGAYLEVRPDLTAFADQVLAGSTSSLQQLGDRVSVPINANTAKYEADWSAAGKRIQGSLKNYLELGGITLGAAGAFDIIKSGLQGVVQEQQQARQATNLWGQEGGTQLQKWADSSVTALGKTKGQALDTANTLGNMLMGFGQSSSTALPMAEQLTQRIADIASAAGKAPADVQAAIDSAMRSGRTATLRDFVPQINDAALKKTAQDLGYIKPKVDDANVQKLKADLVVLNDQITNAQKGGADPQAIELAQNRVTAAQQAHNEAVLRYGSTSHAALVEQNALQAAEMSLAKARTGPMSEQEKQDRVNQLKAQYLVLQNNIDTAEAGTLDKLDQNQKALSVVNLLLQDSASQAGSFGGTTADKVAEATAAWDTAKDHLATGLLPDLTRFADWVTTHGSDINTFADHLGQFLGTAADDAGKLIGWFTDHPDVAKGLAEGLGGIFAIKKLDDWAHGAKRVIGDVGKVFDSILGNKQMPSMKGGGAGAAAASVMNMTVDTLIAKNFIGGGLPAGAAAEGEGVAAAGGAEAATAAEAGVLSKAGSAALGLVGAATFANPAVAIPAMGMALSGSASTNPEVNPSIAAAQKDVAKPSSQQSLATFLGGNWDSISGADYGQTLTAALSDHNSKAFADAVHIFEGHDPAMIEGLQGLGSGQVGDLTGDEKQKVSAAITAAQQMAYDQGTFLQQVTSLFQSEEQDMLQAASIIYSTRQSQALLEAQTSGLRGAALNAGIGAVAHLQAAGSGKGLVSRDVGGDIPFTGPILAHGGEWVETTNERRGIDQLLLSVGELVAQLRGGVGSTQHMAPVFAPQFSGFSTAELENIIRREFGTFARIMADNEQRGLPPLHGIVSQ